MERNSLFELWNFIKPIWRIVIATIVLQVLGAVLALIKSPYGVPFFDFWFGIVVSAAPGFIAGLAWQYFNSYETLRKNITAVLFVGACCILTSVAALLWPLEEFAEEFNRSFGSK